VEVVVLIMELLLQPLVVVVQVVQNQATLLVYLHKLQTVLQVQSVLVMLVLTLQVILQVLVVVEVHQLQAQG